MSDRTAVIVGASAGVGRALAEALARVQYRLLLVARDQRDLDATAADSSLRFGVACSGVSWDLADERLAPEGLLACALERLGHVDALFLVAGYADPQDEAGLSDDPAVVAVMRVNYSSAVRLAAAFAAHFEPRGTGRIVGFSSIAAPSPRGRNMVYASAKAGLETYLRALRHHFARKGGIIVQCYRLGYVDTAMTFGKRLLFPVTSPQRTAQAVVENLDCDLGLVHHPGFWRLVVWLLGRLPWFIYRRLSF